MLELRPARDRLQRLVRELKPQCEQLRNLTLSTLPIEPFIKIFRDRGLCRLRLLRDQLAELANRAASLEDKPPGFDAYWVQLQTEIDAFYDDSETILRDFDFALGRWCEARWTYAVPKEIATTNLIIEQFIAPRRVKAVASTTRTRRSRPGKGGRLASDLIADDLIRLTYVPA